MIKLLRILAAIMLISLAVPALFADDEFELGMSITPLHMVAGGDDEYTDQYSDTYTDEYMEEKDFLEEWLIGFHFGYSMSFLYATIDAMVLPPFLVSDMTNVDYYDDVKKEWVVIPGVERPAFLNFIDVGAKFTLGSFVLFGEAGINQLYIYRQGDIPDEQKGSFGTNLRIGVSYKVLDSLSVGLTGTAIFPNFETMGKALKGLVSDDEGYDGAAEQLKFLPILMVVMYL